MTDLPSGWTAADATRVSVSPSGRRIVSQRLVAAADAESGEAVALVKDRFGVTVSETPVALRVRGSSNCSSDSTGLACPPASARMVTNFETGTEGWTAGENTSAADAVTSFANGPGKASVGERALEMKPQGSPAGNAWRSVGVTFDEPVATGGAIALAVDVNGYGGGGASNHARITATAVGGEVAEATLPIAPDSWSTVRVPLAELDGAPISTVTVSFRGETAGGWPARFQIDAVRLDTSMPESENLARGKTVTASNPIGCCGWEVGKLTDGQRTSSSNAPGYSNATAYPTPDNVEWVRIDLGTSSPIGRVLLYPRTSRAGEGPELTGRNFPVDFRIETSANGTDWATVGTFTGQQAANGLPRTYYLDEGAEGRYVRVYVTRLGPGAPDEQGEASGGHRLQARRGRGLRPARGRHRDPGPASRPERGRGRGCSFLGERHLGSLSHGDLGAQRRRRAVRGRPAGHGRDPAGAERGGRRGRYGVPRRRRQRPHDPRGLGGGHAVRGVPRALRGDAAARRLGAPRRRHGVVRGGGRGHRRALPVAAQRRRPGLAAGRRRDRTGAGGEPGRGGPAAGPRASRGLERPGRVRRHGGGPRQRARSPR